MNRKLAVAALALAAIALNACSLDTLRRMVTDDLGVYDETLPQNQLATLTIPLYYTVERFNDQPVKWTTSSLTASFAEIRIPAGTREFEYRFNKPVTGGCSAPRMEVYGNIRRWVRDCSPVVPARSFERAVTVAIEAGKKYTVGEATITRDPGE